ncbi:hypothetical protein [Roseibium algae]|uniref:DNA methylase n=1 Tax=Roseibium algae TaxID=3123038 RepID=A0ABU8TNY5_9HYPH
MSSGALYDSFIYPPFSVLDARAKWWQDRKKKWLSLGIDSGKGRKQDLLNGYSDAMARWSASQGKQAAPADWMAKSIFDPVLTELFYAWFSPVGGRVLDPFAGGSVRGVVAGLKGRNYLGFDISEEQIEENRRQAKALQLILNRSGKRAMRSGSISQVCAASSI